VEIMPEGGLWAGWDFLALVAFWNLCGLPFLLVVVAVVFVIRVLSRPPARGRADDVATIRRIGLYHYVMGLRALIQLAQEILSLRTMGIFESNPITGLIFPAVSALVNPLLGLGLRRLRPRARRSAIVWYALSSFFAVGTTYWMWRYHAAASLIDWPDHVAGKGTPLVLLFIMTLPNIRQNFGQQLGQQTEPEPVQPQAGALEAPARSRHTGALLLSLLVLLLLLVACSTLVVDVADWIQRLVAESGPSDGPQLP
jgi:hypothetical protein